MSAYFPCLEETENPVVVVEGGVDVTLTADEMFAAIGTVQVAANAEITTTSVPTPPNGYTAQTTHIIK